MIIWATNNGVKLGFIDQGKPMQNGYIDSFNGLLSTDPKNGGGASLLNVTEAGSDGRGQLPKLGYANGNLACWVLLQNQNAQAIDQMGNLGYTAVTVMRS